MEYNIPEYDITRIAQTFMEYTCGCGNTHRSTWANGLNRVDSTCGPPHKNTFMIHSNMDVIQPLMISYNSQGTYHVNATRVADGCMYYKCKYCKREHHHSRGVRGDNQRTSHCELKRGQVIVKLSERLANR